MERCDSLNTLVAKMEEATTCLHYSVSQ